MVRERKIHDELDNSALSAKLKILLIPFRVPIFPSLSHASVFDIPLAV